MLPEQPLRAIDYCDHALLVAAESHLPSWETIRGCTICSRRWWLAAARLGGWEPLPRGPALALSAQMAAALLSGREVADDSTARGFYAYLATAPADEADFAALIASLREDPLAIAPPRDFGWRALFAPPNDPSMARDPAYTTRIWQWRAIGATIAAEGRTFVDGDAPPPFAQPPPAATGRWLREGPPQQTPLLRQQIGPLLVMLEALANDETVALTLRLRDNAQAETVSARIYRGGDNGRDTIAWRGTLSDAAREQRLTFTAEELATFTIELDTAW